MVTSKARQKSEMQSPRHLAKEGDSAFLLSTQKEQQSRPAFPNNTDQFLFAKHDLDSSPALSPGHDISLT